MSKSFIWNALPLITGSMIAQAIPFAISPLLTRIYTPEDFGVFGVFMAITSILGICINARYDTAIALANSDEDAINVAGVAVIISTTISLISLFIITFFKNELFGHFNHNNLGFSVYFIPISIFLYGLFNVLNYLNLRMKLFKDIGRSAVYKSLALAISQLFLGIIKLESLGLALGLIASQILGNGKLLKNVLKTRLQYSLSLTSIKKQAIKYRKFPFYSAIPAFLDASTVSLPLIWLGDLYGPVVLGYFAFCYRLLGAPAALIGNSIGSVFYQKISEVMRLKRQSFEKGISFSKAKRQNEDIFSKHDEVKSYLISALAKLTIIGFIMFLPLILLSPFLFDMLFGEVWRTSGEYARILSVAFFIRFIVSPVSCVFSVTNHLGLAFCWRIVRFPSTALIFFISKKLEFSVFSFLYLYVANDILMYVLCFAMIFYAANKEG